MSNQEMTYLNSRVLESSSESQNPIRPDETHGPREVGHKVALGILCLLLMMAISVWLIYRKHVEGHLFCCGIKCYYFIMDMDHKHWSGCKQTCQDCSLSLLKIDDDDEPKFLPSQVTTNRYWIGLKYNGSKGEWQWIGDVPSKLNLKTVKLLKESGVCAFLSFGGIHEDDCGRKHPCICEKRMDKFPGSMYSMKEK